MRTGQPQSRKCQLKSGKRAYTWRVFSTAAAPYLHQPIQLDTRGLTQVRMLYPVNWKLVMAGTVVVMAPVIVLFTVAQKASVQGVTLKGLNG